MKSKARLCEYMFCVCTLYVDVNKLMHSKVIIV